MAEDVLEALETSSFLVSAGEAARMHVDARWRDPPQRAAIQQHEASSRASFGAWSVELIRPTAWSRSRSLVCRAGAGRVSFAGGGRGSEDIPARDKEKKRRKIGEIFHWDMCTRPLAARDGTCFEAKKQSKEMEKSWSSSLLRRAVADEDGRAWRADRSSTQAQAKHVSHHDLQASPLHSGRRC